MAWRVQAKSALVLCEERKVGPFKFKQWPLPEEPFTKSNQFKRTLLTSWINILLVCVPVGLTLGFVHGSSVSTFIVNYLAEVPLWFMCDYALEEIEKYLPRTISDLLDIFTNNTVQLISSILLLKQGEVSLLQTSLVGGILSNILVLLGLSLLSGGMRNHTQRFNRTGAQGSSALLSIATTSVLIPTAERELGQISLENLILQCRGIAVVLLFIFFTYTFCQMYTHKEDYQDWGNSASHQRPRNERGIELLIKQTAFQVASPIAEPVARRMALGPPAAVDSTKAPTAACAEEGPAAAPTAPTASREGQPHADEITGPQLHLAVATLVFVATVGLLFLCINATVDSLSILTGEAGLSPTFVGLILLPVPNYDFAAVSLAADDYLGQAVKYTVGRSIQTALLVLPLVVLMGWGMQVPGGVTLALDGFEVVSLFTTILLLNFLVVDAKVHWVHGVLLLADWVLIAIAAYFVSPREQN